MAARSTFIEEPCNVPAALQGLLATHGCNVFQYRHYEKAECPIDETERRISILKCDLLARLGDIHWLLTPATFGEGVLQHAAHFLSPGCLDITVQLADWQNVMLPP